MLQIAERVAVRLDPSRAALDDKGEALIRKMGDTFAANLGLAIEGLDRLATGGWQGEPILAALKTVAEAHQLKLGDVMQPVRVALTGSTVSEPVNDLLAAMDRPTVMAALRRARGRVGRREGPPDTAA